MLPAYGAGGLFTYRFFQAQAIVLAEHLDGAHSRIGWPSRSGVSKPCRRGIPNKSANLPPVPSQLAYTGLVHGQLQPPCCPLESSRRRVPGCPAGFPFGATQRPAAGMHSFFRADGPRAFTVLVREARCLHGGSG